MALKIPKSITKRLYNHLETLKEEITTLYHSTFHPNQHNCPAQDPNHHKYTSFPNDTSNQVFSSWSIKSSHTIIFHIIIPNFVSLGLCKTRISACHSSPYQSWQDHCIIELFYYTISCRVNASHNLFCYKPLLCVTMPWRTNAHSTLSLLYHFIMLSNLFLINHFYCIISFKIPASTRVAVVFFSWGSKSIMTMRYASELMLILL